MQLQVLHLRFSGPERIHRDIKQEIEALLHERYAKRVSLPHKDGSDDPLARIVNQTNTLAPSNYRLSEAAQKPTSVCDAEEFLSFADWAFGPSGLPNLEILAFGDFSYEDRYSSQQFLVRRVGDAEECIQEDDRLAMYEPSGLSFCSADIADPRIWNRVSMDGAQFLGACPEGGLVESPYDI
jgi:hypothetical protein